MKNEKLSNNSLPNIPETESSEELNSESLEKIPIKIEGNKFKTPIELSSNAIKDVEEQEIVETNLQIEEEQKVSEIDSVNTLVIPKLNLESFEKLPTRLKCKRPKTVIKLTTTSNAIDGVNVKDSVGDDSSKKKQQNIICECQPSVAGGAVPAVCSFTGSERSNENSNIDMSSVHSTKSIASRHKSGQSLIPKLSRSKDKKVNSSQEKVNMKRPPIVKKIVNNNNDNSNLFSHGKSPFLGGPSINLLTNSKRKLVVPSTTKSEENYIESVKSNETDINKMVTNMKKTVSDVAAKTQIRSQKDFANKLLADISHIEVALNLMTNTGKKEDVSIQTEGISDRTVKNESSSCKGKNNKVHIKFAHSQDKSMTQENNDNVIRLSSGNALFGTDTSNVNEELKNVTKNVESMDGVFIPAPTPPNNIEDEEEPNGLDITITFPEFNDRSESRLTVQLSDISRDTLRRLKRCPKDLTLHMDFVQELLKFQSGKRDSSESKIVDDKNSEIINIKPVTECKFPSQPMSVEHLDAPSNKSLRSVDAELFNVVNFPYMYKNASMNAVTKSCITFRNGNVSLAYLMGHLFKSAPQIPSLANILEDGVANDKPALIVPEKKRKGRGNLKKIVTPNTAE